MLIELNLVYHSLMLIELMSWYKIKFRESIILSRPSSQTSLHPIIYSFIRVLQSPGHVMIIINSLTIRGQKYVSVGNTYAYVSSPYLRLFNVG